MSPATIAFVLITGFTAPSGALTSIVIPGIADWGAVAHQRGALVAKLSCPDSNIRSILGQPFLE
jgi:hypothetical protein